MVDESFHDSLGIYACIYVIQNFSAGRTGRTDQPKVVQEVLTDLKTEEDTNDEAEGGPGGQGGQDYQPRLYAF